MDSTASSEPTAAVVETQREQQPLEETQDEAEEEQILEEVLRDLALIEAALATNSSASLANDDAIEIEIGIDNGNDTVALTSSRLRAPSTDVDDVPLLQEADAFGSAPAQRDDVARWQPPDPLTSSDDDALPWRRAWLQDRDDYTPTEVVPMAAACVLLLLLSSWGHLRRSRRRVLERQEDAWRRDVDLVDSAYRGHTPPRR